MTTEYYNNAPTLCLDTLPDGVIPPASAAQNVRVTTELAGLRLDAALARIFPDYSRSQLTQWLKAGRLTVDGGQPRPRDKVQGGELIHLVLPSAAVGADEPEAIALDIVYADSDLIVVNKPAGLVVHPAAGHRAGTLVNALLHFAPELARLPRAGIVHRLDKDTSGLLAVARNPRAQTSLVRQLQDRSMHREYCAVVQGVLISGGSIDAPIGRHPVDRKRMAVVSGGKPARTHYRISERLRAHTVLNVELETGRTHQIRVHFAHVGHPVLGDPTYGGRPRPVREMAAESADVLAAWQRQALHAAVLGLEHPQSGLPLRLEAPLPADFSVLLEALRADAERWARRL